MAGAAAFAAADLFERWHWHRWFDPAGGYTPWFLNSGRAVAFTAVWVFACGLALGVFRGNAATPRNGIAAAVAAVAAMAVVLIINGPGTIFPIAMTIGGAIVAGCVVAGWWIGSRFDS